MMNRLISGNSVGRFAAPEGKPSSGHLSRRSPELNDTITVLSDNPIRNGRDDLADDRAALTMPN
jgi:hypothetical protein